jgi:hypothetical protein
LKLLFDHPKAQLHAWDKNNLSITQLKDINKFNVCKFLSPAILPAYSQRTFYFGARVCFGNMPHQVWLSNAITKLMMKEQNIRVSVSNSACNSGKLITAGYIFSQTSNHDPSSSIPPVTSKQASKLHTALRYFDPLQES